MTGAINLIEPLLLFSLIYFLAFPLGYLIVSRSKSSSTMALFFLPLFIAVLASPLIIPPSHPAIRFLLFIPIFNSLIRNSDLVIQIKNLPRIKNSLHEYLRYTTSGFGAENSAPDSRPNRKSGIKQGFINTFSGLVVIFLILLLLLANTYFRTPEWAYWLSTGCKMLYFYLAADALANLYFGISLFSGRSVTPIYHEPLLARSPADFWTNRMNLNVQQALYRFIYVPVGSRMGAFLGVFCVFIFSGVFHEIQFDLSASRITGYPLLFFAIQGAAVVAELKFKRYIRRRHSRFYQQVSRNQFLDFIFIPLNLLFLLFTGSFGIKAFDLIIDVHNLEPIKHILYFLHLPPL